MASARHAQPQFHPQPPPHIPTSRLPPPSSYQNQQNSGPPGGGPNHPLNGRHLPPLSQSPNYSHPNTLPPLSPFSHHRHYSNGSFPPPLSRQSSQHQHPSQQQQQQQHNPPPPPHPHYPPPSHSSHWDQPSRHSVHDQPPNLPPPQSSQQQQQQQHQPPPPLRQDSSGSFNGPPRKKSFVGDPNGSTPNEPPPPVPTPVRDPGDDGLPATSDFVKKLYKMLEEPSFLHIVCWGPQGDCFVVKDMTEFTKNILPKMFKHSNFASFVRQLNKYDFHKIKNADDGQYGEHSWTFRHPDFQADKRDALENIKRKVPSQKKGARNSTAANGINGVNNAGSPPDASPVTTTSGADHTVTIASMQAQIDRLMASNADLSARFQAVDANHQSAVQQLVSFQKSMAVQDSVMQNIIQYLSLLEGGGSSQKPKSSADNSRNAFDSFNSGSRSVNFSTAASSIDSNGTLVSDRTMSPNTSNDMAARSAVQRQDMLNRLDELRRIRMGEAEPRPATVATPSTQPFLTPLNGSRAAQQSQYEQQFMESSSPVGPDRSPHSARSERNGEWQSYNNVSEAAPISVQPVQPGASIELMETPSFPPQPPLQQRASAEHPSYQDPEPMIGRPSSAGVGSPGGPGGARFRVRRAAGGFTPGWAVPPRVLLVDDDQVSRRLFSKFLQVSGCTIDVAVDGIGAVNKMNLEKYDLVLMDIVMPKLDGVSATSLIRQFDHMTPIISMTSNSKPNEVLHYYSNGMNDILPKPFTRETLFTMLEKHLMHLKATLGMGNGGANSIPRGGPSGNIEEDLGSSSKQSAGNMGFTDDQYSVMISNLLGMSGAGDLATLDGGGFGIVPNGLIASDLGGLGVGLGSGPKRGLEEVVADEERENKRGRFEVLE